MSIQDRPFRNQVRYVDPAVDDVRTSAVRRQIKQDFGVLAPPFALHLPAPDILPAYWAIFREPTFGRRVERATKEAVAAAVSEINKCPYCVDVHTTMLLALGHPAWAMAIDSGATDDVVDSELRGVVAWARASRQPDAPILRHPPFPDEYAPELIGVAVAYHYINRMVSVFAVESPFPSESSRAKPIMRRVAAAFLRRLLARKVIPGASLDLLAPAPLPVDFGWAQGDPVIADAFARAAAVFDRAGRQALPDAVRELVMDRLSAWRGDDPGLSRGWVEAAIATLPAAQRPLGQFTLLTALAPYQVDAGVVHGARTVAGPAGDYALLAAAGWASFSAARRIGSWLRPVPATAGNGQDLVP